LFELQTATGVWAWPRAMDDFARKRKLVIPSGVDVLRCANHAEAISDGRLWATIGRPPPGQGASSTGTRRSGWRLPAARMRPIPPRLWCSLPPIAANSPRRSLGATGAVPPLPLALSNLMWERKRLTVLANDAQSCAISLNTERRPMNVEITRLPNGLTVATEPDASTGECEPRCVGELRRAARNRASDGVSHMLEHMAFQGDGAPNCACIAEEIEADRWALNAYNDREQTGIPCACSQGGRALAVDILAIFSRTPSSIGRDRGARPGRAAGNRTSTRHARRHCFRPSAVGRSIPDSPWVGPFSGTRKRSPASSATTSRPT